MALDAAFAAAGGGVSLALAAMLWAVDHRRRARFEAERLTAAAESARRQAEAATAAAAVFGGVVLALDGPEATRVAGAETWPAVCAALGLPPDAAPGEVLQAVQACDSAHARRLRALVERGEPFALEARTPSGLVRVEGRPGGALAWLRLAPAALSPLPAALDGLAAFLDAQPHPAFALQPGGRLAWANAAWLKAAGAESVDDAHRRNLAFDRGIESLAAEAAALGQRREDRRWATVQGARRAFLVFAAPLEGGGAAAMAVDVTALEEAEAELRRRLAAQDATLNRVRDAVAIFGADQRLAFHNAAFAELWGVEPAWLAERPSHGELLDRLRQRRRLPETADYAGFKRRELALYESLEGAPDDIWSLPDGRTLKVVRQPHAAGGLLLLFSDITDELKLRAQYNGLVQVQQATLDKLNDAVAVFGSDGRLRLHNEAFERFWNLTPQALEGAGDVDGVAELCLPLLHDRQFWRELKARVGDPGPQARRPVAGEVRTSDQRAVVYQTRPLPDGATLVAFDDVTATRRIEQALADRSQALAEAERLKRDFVGNVSYELRTPLTTIIGYAELLESQGETLPERARTFVAAVRTAAMQLARSIDDVLDTAELDAGEVALHLSDVRVDELLAAAAARAGRAAAEAKVSVEVADSETAGVIRADERRLGQVLDQLLLNAIRSTPEGGAVSLDARRGFGEVQIRVRDTGRGIPFQVQAHIFDRFVARERGGPGLGLALVKALVELHGGWVALESEPGRGAVFTCHLPESAYAGSAHPELQFGT